MIPSSNYRKSISRRVFSKALKWLAMVLIVILGVVGANAAFFGAAFLLSTPDVLLVIAFSVGFLITFGMGGKLD